MTEKSPSKMQLGLALSRDLAAGGVCWVESWCWHVLSLPEKSRLSSYFIQTRLLHLMWMAAGTQAESRFCASRSVGFLSCLCQLMGALCSEVQLFPPQQRTHT